MLCVKIVWNSPSGSSQILSIYFCYFVITSPWKRMGPLLSKTWNPFTHDALCQVWLVLRRRFLNFINVFSLFRNFLPLEKGETLDLIKLEFPSPKDALYQGWLKLAHWFWRRRWKCEKCRDGQKNGRTTNNRRSEKLTFSSVELNTISYIITELRVMI